MLEQGWNWSLQDGSHPRAGLEIPALDILSLNKTDIEKAIGTIGSHLFCKYLRKLLLAGSGELTHITKSCYQLFVVQSLVESLVPTYTSSSIFSQELWSGDAGERDNMSGVRDCGYGVIWGWKIPKGRPWVQNLGAVLVRRSLSVGMAQLGLCP